MSAPADDQPYVISGSYSIVILPPVPDEHYPLFVEEIEALSESLAHLAEVGRRKLSESQ